MKEKPFKDAIYIRTDDLPDEYRQQVIELTELIIVNALVDLKNNKERNPNIALGALQRSLGLVIAKVFRKDDLEPILDGICTALKVSAKEWSDDT